MITTPLHRAQRGDSSTVIHDVAVHPYARTHQHTKNRCTSSAGHGGRRWMRAAVLRDAQQRDLLTGGARVHGAPPPHPHMTQLCIRYDGKEVCQRRQVPGFNCRPCAGGSTGFESLMARFFDDLIMSRRHCHCSRSPQPSRPGGFCQASSRMFWPNTGRTHSNRLTCSVLS
jgi:hypothetical protein